MIREPKYSAIRRRDLVESSRRSFTVPARQEPPCSTDACVNPLQSSFSSQIPFCLHPRPQRLFAKGNIGFTLVELLVVMAIMGILAVLLAPVAQKMRTSGLAVKDVSNLRRIGEGIMLYAQDNEMKLPPMSPKPWQSPFYSFLVSPYIDQPSPCKEINGLVQAYGVWRCPGPWRPHWISDYGANNFVFSDQGKQLPLTRIPKPASTLLLANVGNAAGNQYGFFLNAWVQYSLDDPSPSGSNGFWPVFIWNGGTAFHALFADGGVKSVSKDDFRQNYKTYLGTTPLWNGMP